MAQVIRSLEEIATVYRIFEKDQVLTHDQLNSIASYFDDQTRLTRVKLIGVGIVCGLRVSIDGGNVKVTRGVGVTTDGDLLSLDDTLFDRFKRYDDSNPAYPPFSSGETRIALFELVAQETADPRATPLAQFNTEAGAPLEEMVALLLMESYLKDDDLCSGTDCDNLGKDCVNTVKLLIVGKGDAGALNREIGLPGEAAGRIAPVTADRPLFSSSVAGLSQLAQIYRAACNAIHEKLLSVFPKIYPNCEPFLKEAFPTDPAAGWAARLTKTKGSVGDLGIQYYYDFLKDLVETYNRFLECLYEESSWCCPDLDAFPKHLLLGNLIPGADPEENRTGSYPSPWVSRTAEQLREAKFLIRKIGALIEGFQIPAAGQSPIRVTPSFTEERPLEARAIPYYYPVNANNPVHKSWNERLTRRRMETYNYSYHAAAYGAQGGAAAPFASQIGPFSFFRVEGHLGRPVTAALAELQRGIAANNIPFTVRAVLVGSGNDRPVKPPIRYTDLNRFHFLLRQDLFHRLDEVAAFSDKFKQRVDAAVTDEPDAATLKELAGQKNNAVAAKTASARTKLNRSYSEYKSDPTWKDDLNDTTTAAGEFKFNLGEVVKTEFPTPFDSLIGTTNDRWLEWLDELVDRKDRNEEEKLLFSKFISQHPALEHFGGVVRGGTFVLVYDANQTVVADFMLPYICCEEVEEEDERGLPKPGVKSGWVLENGIKIRPSLDRFVKTKLNLFETDLDKKWTPKIDLQKDYFNVFEKSVGMMGNVLVDVGKGKAPTTPGKLADPLLDLRVNESRLIREKVELLKEKAADPALAEEVRTKFQEEAKAAETGLAKSLEETTRYISESGADVSTEGEGFKAMLEVSSGFSALSDTETVKLAKSALTGVQKSTGNAGLKVVIGNMLKK